MSKLRELREALGCLFQTVEHELFAASRHMPSPEGAAALVDELRALEQAGGVSGPGPPQERPREWMMAETHEGHESERVRRLFPDVDRVLDNEHLSTEEKQHILLQWEYDARLLEVAEEENMRGKDVSPLAKIRAAQNRLGISRVEGTGADTKQGGAPGREGTTGREPHGRG